jgi:hypothetical protein
MKTNPFDVIKQLDGLSIREAQIVLEGAMRLLTSTQLVVANSPLLVDAENKARQSSSAEKPEKTL